MDANKRVAIAGGGIAGLTCAKSLVDEGWQVSVFEQAPFLGGRASTYRDEDGDWIEQGLHLFLGTYSVLKQLLEEVGAPPDEVLFWMEQMTMSDAQDGSQGTYGVNPLHAPLKTLAGALGNNDFLGPLDKLGAAPLASALTHSYEGLRERFDDKTVTQWWRDKGGSEQVLERVLRPFCRAIQFTDADDFSAFNLLGWIHHSVVDLPHCLLGGYRGARDELMFQPIGRYLSEHGATVRTQAPLKQLVYDKTSNRVEAMIFEDGARVEADTFVLAVAAWDLDKLLPGALREDAFFQKIAQLPVAPAISVQLWLDRHIMKPDLFHLLGRSLMPVYQDQSVSTYPYEGGSRVSVTLSPADDLLSKSDDALVELAMSQLRAVHPEAAQAQVNKQVILRHKAHLIRPLPGAMSARPHQATPVSNLFLAGDWTQQEYFGSQEGAARGGRACAEAILKRPRPR